MAGKREGGKAKEEGEDRKAKKHERVGTRQNELTGGAKGRVGKCGLQTGKPRPPKILTGTKKRKTLRKRAERTSAGAGMQSNQ